MKRHTGLVILSQRHVGEWPRALAKRAVLAVARDTDDFGPRTLRAAKTHALADWVIAFEVTSREGFVDDHSQRRALVVLRSEIAAPQERDAHRREIFQADNVRVDGVLILLIGTGAFAAAYVVGP